MVSLSCVACRHAPTAARPAPSASAGVAPGPLLRIDNPQHDFGTVVQGDVLHQSFEVHNIGSAPLELGAQSEALGCVGTASPASLAPGGVGQLEVSCHTDFFGPLRVTLPVPSNASSTDTAIVLTGEVTPLLAFDTPLLELRMPFGEERRAEVRLIGARAAQAQLKLEDAGDAGFRIRPLPPAAGRAAGLELRVKPKKVGILVGNIVLATNLARPSELTLPYSCKVEGTLDVTPTNPYFDLSAPGPKLQVVLVHSVQPGFVVHGVSVLEGPFRAGIERGTESGQYRVTISVREDKMWDQARSALGKLLILSNDRTEPRKELPLFGFGALNRAEK